MSLRVWLPLTKDLRNQGLSTVSLSGSPTWGTGKIGEKSFCCNTGITGVTVEDLVNVTNFSVAYWLYIDSSISDFTNYADCWELQATSGNTTTVIRDELRANTANLGHHALHMIKDASVGSNTNTYYGLGDRDDAKDKWCHVVLVKNTTYCDVYADGIRYAHVACSNFENSAAKLTGKFWLGMGGCKSAYLNDFRIYDHCLSPMEIKELAKGLVLHYPLNREGWGQENLYYYSKDFSNWTFYSGATTTTDNGENIITYPTTADVWPGAVANKTILYSKVRNKTITISADLKADNGVACGLDPCLILTSSESSVTRLKYKDNTINFTGTGKWIHWSVTYNITDSLLSSGTGSPDYDSCYFSVVFYRRVTPTGSFKLKNPKVELGSIATPWCPNSSDVLATTMGLNSTIEYDCSGFCNNGTKTGTFSWTSDTPKYDVSTTLDNNTTKLHISGLSTTGFANSYSFAWWGKASTFSNMMQWGFSDGVRLNGIYNGTLWNTGDGGNNPLYNPGTTTQVTAPTTNVWHHYVMVGDGTTCKVYKDGVLWGQAKTYKAISGTSIYFNGWDSGTSYCHTTGYSMSDFRIYATALSADDVKSLYQNSAYIDSSGNVYGAVHSEV